MKTYNAHIVNLINNSETVTTKLTRLKAYKYQQTSTCSYGTRTKNVSRLYYSRPM